MEHCTSLVNLWYIYPLTPKIETLLRCAHNYGLLHTALTLEPYRERLKITLLLKSSPAGDEQQAHAYSRQHKS